MSRHPRFILDGWFDSGRCRLGSPARNVVHAIGASLSRDGIAYPGEGLLRTRTGLGKSALFDALTEACSEGGPFERGRFDLRAKTFYAGEPARRGSVAAFRLRGAVVNGSGNADPIESGKGPESRMKGSGIPDERVRLGDAQTRVRPRNATGTQGKQQGISNTPGGDAPRAPRKDPDLRLQARRVFAYWRVVAARPREMPTERDLRTIEKRLREEAAKGASEPWRVLAAAVEGAALHQFARPNGTTWRAIATIKGTFGTTDRVRECLDLWRQAGKPVTAEAFAAADGEAPDRRDDEAVIETAAENPTPRESETTHRESERNPTTVTASRSTAESEDPDLRRRRLEVERLRSAAA